MTSEYAGSWASFLGPLGENGELLERWVVDAIRSHVYWRRNFHPEDPPAIPSMARLDPEFQKMVVKTEHALHRLDARLKRSVPWFSPRYVGHMASDLMLPGLAARILATLYNPNNVSEDAGGPAVSMELDVGEQLARMFGYATEESAKPRAWGHLTSGGTVANFEGLWLLRAVRLYGPALVQAVHEIGGTLESELLEKQPLLKASASQLIHLSMDRVLQLRREVYAHVLSCEDPELFEDFHQRCEEARCESMGLASFLAQHEIAPPVVLAPASAHYSWTRAMKLLGLGKAQLWSVDVDDHMRLSPTALQERLDQAAAKDIPILAVVAVLGTTEFGAIDPVHKVQAIREAEEAKGRGFALHIDAAWGGYLASIFRQEDGSMVPYKKLRRQFHYFPSEDVYQSFAALSKADTITVDPHKLGFLPYPAGALVIRDRETAMLLSEAPPYIFDGADASPNQADLSHLGQFILEGSKPGASAASVYVTHQVWPLHLGGFGQIMRRLIMHGERLYELLRSLARDLEPHAILAVPFEADSNLICLGVNPLGNTSLAQMNRFTRALFQAMKFTAHEPLQTRSFIGSFTSLSSQRLTTSQSERIFKMFQLDTDSFEKKDGAGQDHIFLLRHTLMNPWLSPSYDGAMDYLDAYLDFLKDRVLALLRKGPSAWDE
ncbi:MAG: pyridoxal-dependent decarboxylase [Myxococcales bacterium]|nr:pyridoxal-dependent decarboxylase [Myxococcales bacterium]